MMQLKPRKVNVSCSTSYVNPNITFVGFCVHLGARKTTGKLEKDASKVIGIKQVIRRGKTGKEV